MEDRMIINLFFERSETAITELSHKYGKRCIAMSLSVLGNAEDAEECVNDAYLAVWNAIPPTRPEALGAYVARITRNLALNKYRMSLAKKRNAHYDVCLDELEEILRSNETVEDAILSGELKGAVNRFLETLGKTDRVLFVERFWFGKESSEIAKTIGKSTNYVNVHLHRIKERLQKFLRVEEWI